MLSSFSLFIRSATAAPPVAAAIAAPAQQPFLDFFGEELDGSTSNGAASNSQPMQKASDDLLQLAANPFASPTAAPPAIPPLPTNSWSGQNGTGFTSQFASDNSFATVFGNGTSQPANGMLFFSTYYYDASLNLANNLSCTNRNLHNPSFFPCTSVALYDCR